MMPLNTPSIKPKIIFSVLYDEILPSNKNNNKLVNNRKTIKEHVKISLRANVRLRYDPLRQLLVVLSIE